MVSMVNFSKFSNHEKYVLVRKYTLKHYGLKRPNIYSFLSNDSRNIFGPENPP